MDPRIFEIVSVKPELIVEFPDWMLSKETENELRETEGLAIAEIAGRDSIAAVLQAAKTGNIKAILPTLAYTGTEFGNWEAPVKKIHQIKEELNKKGIKVFDTVLLGAPKFWWHLCGRYATDLFKRFGFYSPCVGCHLYLHAVRIPLAKKINCDVLIGGERESHDGKTKINQIECALDAYTHLAESFGVKLLLPLRQVRSGKVIESITGHLWKKDTEQLECVMSKNYLERDGSVIYSEDDIKRFFKEFALPEAEKEIKRLLTAMQ